MVMSEFMSATVLSLGGDRMADWSFESAIICSDSAFMDATIFPWVHASATSNAVS